MTRHKYTIGIDEVGRGSLAGPLCVGACLVRRTLARSLGRVFSGIRDSKQLTPAGREMWFRTISEASRQGLCEWRTVFVSEKVIDERGLSFALRRAIRRLLSKLGVHPRLSRVLLDGGIWAPRSFLFQKTIVRGDETEPLIAAASIMAKVRRDRYMVRLSRRHPAYGFDRHKGYGTKAHYEALRKHGISGVHRKSFLFKFEARSTKSETIDSSVVPAKAGNQNSGFPLSRE